MIFAYFLALIGFLGFIITEKSLFLLLVVNAFPMVWMVYCDFKEKVEQLEERIKELRK